MSWLFSFFLACYAAVRLVLWCRGQLRWMSVRRSLPVPPTDVDPPKHLSTGLSELFLETRHLRAELVRARAMLTVVEVVDPDAPLGQIRDRRYRRALMESWSFVNAWLRTVDALGTGDAMILERKHIGQDRVSALRESLRDKWRAAAQSRALDPVALDDLTAVKAALEQLERELVVIERGLAREGEHPYRERYVDAEALAAMGC